MASPQTTLDALRDNIPQIGPLLDDPDIEEIMVIRGGARVYIERGGVKALVEGFTINPFDLESAIIRIARAGGQDDVDDRRMPTVEVRLPDGSRVCAIIGSCSIDGATLSIRRFGRIFTLPELVDRHMFTHADADRLQADLAAKKNIVICGQTSSGKSTVLRCLASLIPHDQRIILIESVAELDIPDHPHVAHWQARRAHLSSNPDDMRTAVTVRDLVRHSLRQNPDRLIVSEVMDADAYDLIQAWNTGHKGTLTTVHADSAEDAIDRLVLCILQAGTGITEDTAYRLLTRKMDVVLHLHKLDTGPHAGRRVLHQYLDLSETRRRDRSPAAPHLRAIS